LDGPNEKADELLAAIRRQLTHLERQPAPTSNGAESPALDDESPVDAAPPEMPLPRPTGLDPRVALIPGTILAALLAALAIGTVFDGGVRLTAELFVGFLAAAIAAANPARMA